MNKKARPNYMLVKRYAVEFKDTDRWNSITRKSYIMQNFFRVGKSLFSTHHSQTHYCVCACAQSLSHIRLCDPIDYSMPVSSVHGISQVRRLESVTISFFRGSSRPRDQTWVSHIAGRCLTLWATREALLWNSLFPCHSASRSCLHSMGCGLFFFF